MFGTAVLFALADVAQWEFRWTDTSTALWELAPWSVLVTVAEYFGVSGILGTARSVPAYLRFSATSAAALLPLLMAFGLLFAAPIVGKNTTLLLFVLGVALAIVLVAFLPAWPVAQALSPRFVAPTRILKATRGFRWGLISMAFILAAINRNHLIPPVEDAHDLGHAFAYAAGEAGIGTISMIYSATIAATALMFAARNDERLYWPR